MPEDDNGLGRGGEISPEMREALKRRSDGIGRRLDEVKTRHGSGSPDQVDRGASYGQAVKIGAELFVGLAFGAGVGWFLDQQFGTAPLLMIVLVILGFAAGLMNVVRGARRAQSKMEALQRSAKPVADDDDN